MFRYLFHIFVVFLSVPLASIFMHTGIGTVAICISFCIVSFHWSTYTVPRHAFSPLVDSHVRHLDLTKKGNAILFYRQKLICKFINIMCLMAWTAHCTTCRKCWLRPGLSWDWEERGPAIPRGGLPELWIRNEVLFALLWGTVVRLTWMKLCSILQTCKQNMSPVCYSACVAVWYLK